MTKQKHEWRLPLSFYDRRHRKWNRVVVDHFTTTPEDGVNTTQLRTELFSGNTHILAWSTCPIWHWISAALVHTQDSAQGSLLRVQNEKHDTRYDVIRDTRSSQRSLYTQPRPRQNFTVRRNWWSRGSEHDRSSQTLILTSSWNITLYSGGILTQLSCNFASLSFRLLHIRSSLWRCAALHTSLQRLVRGVNKLCWLYSWEGNC